MAGDHGRGRAQRPSRGRGAHPDGRVAGHSCDRTRSAGARPHAFLLTHHRGHRGARRKEEPPRAQRITKEKSSKSIDVPSWYFVPFVVNAFLFGLCGGLNREEVDAATDEEHGCPSSQPDFFVKEKTRPKR